MKRKSNLLNRAILNAFWLILVVCMSGFSQDKGKLKEKLPNILLIVIDDLGWADLGYVDSTVKVSPFIDSLANNGLIFRKAYATSSVCSPSRSSLITGLHPVKTGITHYLIGNAYPDTSKLKPAVYAKHLDSNSVTIAQLLKTKGYQTSFFGKWHLSEPRKASAFEPSTFGFDVQIGGRGSANSYYFPQWLKNGPTDMLTDGNEGEYISDYLNRKVIEHLDTLDKRKPFFINLSHYAVHIPLKAPENEIARVGLLNNTPKHHITYAAMISNLDKNMRQLFYALKRNGQLENTIILFTSDNGGLAVPEGGKQPTNNLPLRDGKGCFHEGGIRVPLFVYWQALKQNKRIVDTPVWGLDIVPTLLAVAKVKIPSNLEGRNILELVNGIKWPARNFYFHLPHYTNQYYRPESAMISGDFKLVHLHNSNQYALYNLKNDPSENMDIKSKAPIEFGRLKKELNAWRSANKVLMPN